MTVLYTFSEGWLQKIHDISRELLSKSNRILDDAHCLSDIDDEKVIQLQKEAMEAAREIGRIGLKLGEYAVEKDREQTPPE